MQKISKVIICNEYLCPLVMAYCCDDIRGLYTYYNSSNIKTNVNFGTYLRIMSNNPVREDRDSKSYICCVW